ncbi:MAG: hypothetical protein ACYDG2_26520, partial [Ruminiclostridium sp.]
MSIQVKNDKKLEDEGKVSNSNLNNKIEPSIGFIERFLNILQIGSNFSKKILGIIIFLIVWEFSSRLGLVDTIFIPPFTKVVASFYKLIVSGTLPYHAIISLKRALSGLVFGIL